MYSERIKEKLVGETFEYAPEFNYIINGLLMRYENDTDLNRFFKFSSNFPPICSQFSSNSLIKFLNTNVFFKLFLRIFCTL